MTSYEAESRAKNMFGPSGFIRWISYVKGGTNYQNVSGLVYAVGFMSDKYERILGTSLISWEEAFEVAITVRVIEVGPCLN